MNANVEPAHRAALEVLRGFVWGAAGCSAWIAWSWLSARPAETIGIAALFGGAIGLSIVPLVRTIRADWHGSG